jgi:hypothetical protein
MELFLERPKAAIERVLLANSDLTNKVRSARPSHELPKSCLNAISNICDQLRDCISEELYDDLTGLQRFALLNIGSRLRSIMMNGGSMLSPEFGVKIFNVFPDRIYFNANAGLLAAIKASRDTFDSADASLHKFRAGSFKQRTFGKGNLQVSHTAVRNGKIDVDADIDLYRNPALHLFGEVLTNHLTGKKTDAYRVRSILDEQRVRPLGGFQIFQMS